MSKPIYAEELPAFPTFNTPELYPEQRGMTIRDYFAAKAMQALIQLDNFDIGMGEPSKPNQASDRAYRFADAMLKAREAK